MHERLFAYPATLARCRGAPLLKQRERFLGRCAEQGYARSGLIKIAWQLLVVASSTLVKKRSVTRFRHRTGGTSPSSAISPM